MMQFEQMIARKQKFSTHICFHPLPRGTVCKAGKAHVHIVEKESSITLGQERKVTAPAGGVVIQMTPGTRQVDYKREGCRRGWGAQVRGYSRQGAEDHTSAEQGRPTLESSRSQTWSASILALPRFLNADKECRIFSQHHTDPKNTCITRVGSADNLEICAKSIRLRGVPGRWQPRILRELTVRSKGHERSQEMSGGSERVKVPSPKWTSPWPWFPAIQGQVTEDSEYCKKGRLGVLLPPQPR